jgi:oligopeptide/dipeptide ABC transporter ATP-binding protein
MASIPNLFAPVPADRMLATIPGIVPSLLDLPDGCSFQARCPQMMERCRAEAPPLIVLDDDHTARCWLYA